MPGIGISKMMLLMLRNFFVRYSMRPCILSSGVGFSGC